MPHGIWNLVPRPEVEPLPPVLEVQNLNHWNHQGGSPSLSLYRTICFSPSENPASLHYSFHFTPWGTRVKKVMLAYTRAHT